MVKLEKKTKAYIYFQWNIELFTLRFCRWTSSANEGLGEEDELGKNPVPAFINGRFERRRECGLLDDLLFESFAVLALYIGYEEIWDKTNMS